MGGLRSPRPKAGTERDPLGARHPRRHLGGGAGTAVPPEPQRQPARRFHLDVPEPALGARAPFPLRRARATPSRRGSRQDAAVRLDRGRSARAEARKRRRDILVTLLAAASLTLVIGLVMTPVLILHVVIDVLLIAYVALLVRQRRLAEERSHKVRYLSPAHAPRGRPAGLRAPAPEPALALRRSANG